MASGSGSGGSGGAPPFSPLLFRLFGRYLRRYFARGFDAVRVSRAGPPPADPGRPTIVYSNHPGWWDPILFMLLAGHFYPRREHYGPMDAEALERYRFFRRLGVFGVERDRRRGAAVFLATARAVLARPAATLWVTAEGRFTDPRRRPVELAPGVAHLAARTPEAVVVPLAVEYPFWDERRPQALACFGPPVDRSRLAGEGREAWAALLSARLEACQDALAEEAMSRDPRRFAAIVDGRRGVGGVYDLWRRGRALVRGERFVAAHGGSEHGGSEE